ncbi:MULTISPECIES: HTH-type transcriptional activator IlvY [unclassified Streptomyces]|uniref:HTH-type transcriptional activator IlvY n=1 Tax=unclassified Streptomyces TaxID=2593676 RepID=UPI002253F69A|nr:MULTISPECIES: HTH-type transcriptional activator IlvY [unclassified Streptomyces]MCX5337319.1 HTH-type transcriptional activator IlvY [Streptomyces sp. NBC_00140]MCX5365730.1 HTH-type transcriptional activator IlvY [Streptomyces sp. NBC_00124]
MREDHRDLRLFLHLTQTLNFGRTSLDCHVSAATLTRTVQRLEAGLGHRLLDRGPRGVSLTAEGHRFRAYAVEALELWRSYREEHPDPAELTGRLAVFATVTACQALLPDLLAPFRAAHPQVRLDLRTGDAAAALARLDEGEVDVAVAGIPARLPEPLVGRTVAVTELVLVTARDRPDPDLAGPFVLPHRGLVRDAADRWFRARGTAPEVACEPDGHEGLLTLVALGCGTGVVPRLVLEHSAVRDRLSVVAADPAPEPFPIGLCVRRADLRRPLVAALWSLTAP